MLQAKMSFRRGSSGSLTTSEGRWNTFHDLLTKVSPLSTASFFGETAPEEETPMSTLTEENPDFKMEVKSPRAIKKEWVKRWEENLSYFGDSGPEDTTLNGDDKADPELGVSSPRKVKREWANNPGEDGDLSEGCRSTDSGIVTIENVGSRSYQEGGPNFLTYRDPEQDHRPLSTFGCQTVSFMPTQWNEILETSLENASGPKEDEDDEETYPPPLFSYEQFRPTFRPQTPRSEGRFQPPTSPDYGAYLGADCENPEATSPVPSPSSITSLEGESAQGQQQKRKITWHGSSEEDEKLKKRRLRFGSIPEADVCDSRNENVTLDDIIWERKIAYSKHSLDPKGAAERPDKDDSDSSSSSTSSPTIKPLMDLRQLIRGSCRKDNFRPIIIDGSNVAFLYGKTIRGKKHLFAPFGIQVCIDHFTNLGCTEVYVVLPEEKLHDETIEDPHILQELKASGKLLTSWSRLLTSGKWVSSYDDRMILDLAAKKDGIVISNDQFRDLWKENPDWHPVIENRVTQFRFFPGLPNEIVIPQDPFGRHGPSFLEILTRSGSSG